MKSKLARNFLGILVGHQFTVLLMTIFLNFSDELGELPSTEEIANRSVRIEMDSAEITTIKSVLSSLSTEGSKE